MSVRADSLPETVSIRTLARLLKVNERTIRRWQNPQDDKADDAPKTPIPFSKEGSATVFPLEACIAWFVEYRLSIAARSMSELDLARQRKVTADAELAELQLAKERGQTVPVAVFREKVRAIAATVRSQLLAVPGRYAARMVGIGSLIESQNALDAAVRDILTGLANE